MYKGLCAEINLMPRPIGDHHVFGWADVWAHWSLPYAGKDLLHFGIDLEPKSIGVFPLLGTELDLIPKSRGACRKPGFIVILIKPQILDARLVSGSFGIDLDPRYD